MTLERTHTTTPRTGILRHMAAGVTKGLEGFDRRSGKFLTPNGGWAVTHQDRIYALAMLWATPGTSCYGQRALFDVACRGGDALCAMQDAGGQWEFVKPDGSRWGKTYMPWSIYHWAETHALLRDRLTAARRTRWETGLRLAYEGLARELQTPRAHNIPTWNGMSLVRAAQIFERPDWAIVGRRQIEFSARQQHPAGFWPEGDGPTNGYNHVYVHALGLYYAFTADRKVRTPLRRAATFHATFTYPDGSAVETIDGRQSYTPGAPVMGWPGLALFPEGRRLVRLAFDTLRRNHPDGGLVPQLASACRHVTDGESAPVVADRDGRTVLHRQALVRRQGPWFICVNGFAPAPAARGEIARNRWIKSRSNNLSIWHDDLGVLVGGGHSKNDPLFATFDVWDNGAHRLEPDAISFRQTRATELVTMRFGRTRCRLRLRFMGPRALAVAFEASGVPPGGVRGGLTLRIRQGDPIVWQAGGKRPVHSETRADPLRSIGVFWTPGDGHIKPQLSGNGWRIHMPVGSAFAYPAYPFNPYAIDNAAPPAQALGVLSAPLAGRNAAAMFRIECG